MTHVKIIDQINNIFIMDKEFSNDFKGDYSLEERVKQTKYDVNDNDNKEASLETSKNRTSSTPKGKQNNGSLAAHSCTICYKTFTQKDSLKWHVLTHSNSKSYICDICNCYFNRKDNLEKHMRHVHLSKSVTPTSIINDRMTNEYICSVCTKQFKWKHSLIEHNIIHSDNNPNVCKICGVKFTRSSSLKEHSLVHTGERPHICLFCNTKFTRASQLNIHMRRSHSDISFCNICSLRFEDVKSLSLHLKIHTEAEKDTIKIAHSKKEEKGLFSNIDNFDQHNINNSKKPTSVIKDLKSNEYICSLCNKQFKWKHSLIEHKIIHSDNNPNVCKICGAKFTRSSSLKEHSLVHTGERPHIFLFCDTKFTRASQLNVHMRRRHSGISFCNICGLRFEDVKSLSLHLKIHTEAEKDTIKIANSKKEEKGVFSNTDNFDQHNINNSKKSTSVIKDLKSNEYICSVCNKQFKSETSLIQHQIIHSANNPYVCNVCGAKFLNSSRLKEHTLFHTGFRSHVCLFCISKFIRARDLNAHMRKRHSDIVSCNCCGLRFEDVKSLSLHLKIHTKADIDLIKISYAICGKELTSLLRLKKHLQIHSGEKKIYL